MKIDLHNHTIHSDGVLTEKELIERAISNKVDIFALTDHDSVFGCLNIDEIAKDYNIKVIKGMELSTYYKGENIHIICLFKNNYIPKEIIDFSYEYKEKRKERAILMLKKIHEIYNLKIDLDIFFNESQEIVTRANMMRHIAKLNNMTFNEAKKYIEPSSLAYIPSTKMAVEDGLSLIKNNNGIAILAHPCLTKNQDYVEEILKLGFDGIEIRYPNHFDLENKYKELAKKYNLFISAGSDCHGDNSHADIGTATLNEEEFEPLRKTLNFNI